MQPSREIAVARRGVLHVCKKDLNIEEIIAEMKKELYTLHAERSVIEGRMDKIKKALTGLATLYGDEALSLDFLQSKTLDKATRRGLTHACRSILMEAKLPLRTDEIHQLIVQRRPETLTLHKQPYTAIAAILQRLARRGEVSIVTKARGNTEWSWHNDCSARDTPPSCRDSDPLPAIRFNAPSTIERKCSAHEERE